MATASVEIATVQEMMPGSVGLASGIVIGIPQGVSALSMVLIGVMADFLGMPFALSVQVIFMLLAIIACAALPYPLKILKRYTA